MSLSPRQTRRYLSMATVYRRLTFGSERYTKVAEHVPCAIASAPHHDLGAPLVGLVKENARAASDAAHFEASQDVRGEDVLHIELGSRERSGEWFATTGTAEVHEFRARFRRLPIAGIKRLTAEQMDP